MFWCDNFPWLRTHVCGYIHDKDMDYRKKGRLSELKNVTIHLNWGEKETVCNKCIDKLLKYFANNNFQLLINVDKCKKILYISWEGKGLPG